MRCARDAVRVVFAVALDVVVVVVVVVVGVVVDDDVVVVVVVVDVVDLENHNSLCAESQKNAKMTWN